MGGYFHDQVKFEGRPLHGASFDTTNLNEPVRDQQFDTSTFGQGPHRPQTFETMNVDPPVRVPQTTKHDAHTSSNRVEPEAKKSSERTPELPQQVTKSSRMTAKVVIAALALRICVALCLIIGLERIASFSQDIDGVTLSFRSSSSTEYALAVTSLGLVYSKFEIVFMVKRLITGRPMFPGRISSYISYIGDQICIVLLMSGGSAGAALLKELGELEPDGIPFCDVTGNFCSQTAAGVAMIFLAFVFLIGSYIISAICFHRKKV